jgi:hypothetical protein
MGRKKRKPKPKQPPRKQEKSKQKRRKPITRKPRKKRAPTPEQRIVNEALRQSPDMTAMLEKNNWELFVPPDSLEGEGVAVAASAQAKKHADVDKFLKMKQEYGEALAFEHQMELDKIRRSRPHTPVVPFGDYMEEQDAETQREKGDESLLDAFAGTTFDTNKSKNEFTFSFPGGKRKSRRRKKSRRRRKKSRRRKTKRKSRRRRK